jgi:hypothetical protein
MQFATSVSLSRKAAASFSSKERRSSSKAWCSKIYQVGEAIKDSKATWAVISLEEKYYISVKTNPRRQKQA